MSAHEKRRKYEDAIIKAILIATGDMFLLNDPTEIRCVALNPVDRRTDVVNKARRIYHAARNTAELLLRK